MDLESEYNNRAKVPNHPDIIAGWARTSANLRTTHPHAELDLSYGPTPRQALDIFWPDDRRDGPITLFIHGGYWQAMDKSYFSFVAAGVLPQGVAMAILSYDLCPNVTLATLTGQVRAAAAFLYRRHNRRMLATGHSAGGHLTAMLMATDWPARGLPPDLIGAGLTLSGVFDLLPLVSTTINAGLHLDPATAHALSPLNLPSPALPLLAVVGGDEGIEYTSQSRQMAEAWAGTWQALPGHDHFTIVAELANPETALARQAAAMAKAVT